ncbi:deazaflavin-dependent oxidoreductase, nitroreductase family [Actinacidiphila rubida]|uniref:Deazaflavin-dependent oxidoreductase, nitroreductase family n=1 Tax=Actinacidiphila rubida TaxID=310780 RepID=A0A1H8RZQ1_9ACTN|nr:hypothetical protein [Actinacidiphila rubida]SEO71845.1 deazaflavin-dependent oxidoreductase, nitroreductase family [Actinacidiphila rubida]
MSGDTSGAGPSPDRRVRTLRGQRAVNLLVRAMLRTPGLSRTAGSRLVTLYVVGRTSGRRYAVPVAYLPDGDDLLIGTSFPWARNLRTGETVQVRFRGRLCTAGVHVDTAEPDVVRAYAHMARTNPTFARFNAIRTDGTGEPDPGDLHQAWLGGARAIRLTAPARSARAAGRQVHRT